MIDYLVSIKLLAKHHILFIYPSTNEILFANFRQLKHKTLAHTKKKNE